jgi:hypothetical protein
VPTYHLQVLDRSILPDDGLQHHSTLDAG